MTELMDLIKPQLDGMREMYRVGYAAGLAEGRRQANAEFESGLSKIQQSVPSCCPECDDHDAEEREANG